MAIIYFTVSSWRVGLSQIPLWPLEAQERVRPREGWMLSVLFGGSPGPLCTLGLGGANNLVRVREA